MRLQRCLIFGVWFHLILPGEQQPKKTVTQISVCCVQCFLWLKDHKHVSCITKYMLVGISSDIWQVSEDNSTPGRLFHISGSQAAVNKTHCWFALPAETLRNVTAYEGQNFTVREAAYTNFITTLPKMIQFRGRIPSKMLMTIPVNQELIPQSDQSSSSALYRNTWTCHCWSQELQIMF